MNAMPLAGYDRIVERTPARVVVERTFRAGEAFVAGHFPNRSIFPGVFVLEIMKEAVTRGYADVARLAEVRRLSFMRPLLPRDVLTCVCSRQESGGRGALFKCEARNGDGQKLATAELRFELVGES